MPITHDPAPTLPRGCEVGLAMPLKDSRLPKKSLVAQLEKLYHPFAEPEWHKWVVLEGGIQINVTECSNL